MSRRGRSQSLLGRAERATSSRAFVAAGDVRALRLGLRHPEGRSEENGECANQNGVGAMTASATRVSQSRGRSTGREFSASRLSSPSAMAFIPVSDRWSAANRTHFSGASIRASSHVLVWVAVHPFSSLKSAYQNRCSDGMGREPHSRRRRPHTRCDRPRSCDSMMIHGRRVVRNGSSYVRLCR